MPSRFATERRLSPNGLLMQPNGKSEKCRLPEFAELPDYAVEPYADANDRSLQCEAYINRIGANP